MISVNIFGSCVSRDIFRFDKDKSFEIPLYIARTSIVSALQRKIWGGVRKRA